jgi:hypothetical protein
MLYAPVYVACALNPVGVIALPVLPAVFVDPSGGSCLLGRTRPALLHKAFFGWNRLRPRHWLDEGSLGLDVDQRGAIDTIKPANSDVVTQNANKLHDGRPYGVGAHGRPQRKRAMHMSVVSRALQHDISRGLMEPVKDLKLLIALDSSDRIAPGRSNIENAGRTVYGTLARGFSTRFLRRPRLTYEIKPRMWFIGKCNLQFVDT